ncbi:phage tail protein [Chryseobacterium sp. SG20098]|uniref:phage tail protein n=1 Tax=Chryseobacterium sp. SG20098 TaxID=3074145 RepID=UPI0028831605|nr:phage tail protein [Chryseobacterium sp. SG20098]WNI36452.1 phage tail protein [Chryseobacterium sp. SG20098]
MKKFSITVIVLFSQIVYSQSAGVGINTTTPKSTFDINGKKDSSGLAVSTDIAGLQAPRLTRAELTSKGDTLYGPDQKGAIVYITDVSGGNVTGPRSNISSVGYYYFDGSAWQKIGMSSDVEQNIGSITAFSYASVPSSYLVCDGSAVSRATYSALFAKIGTTYGSGDGSTTFNLPDLRGEFIRGLDLGRGVDTGRALGTSQTDDFKSHKHDIQTEYGNGQVVGYRNPVYDATTAPLESGVRGQYNSIVTIPNSGYVSSNPIRNNGGTETRSRNVAMVYAIKAKESAVLSSSDSQTIQSLTTALQPWYSTTTGTGATTVTENIYHSGNVGIGTTSPTTKLHLESSTSGAFRYADGTQGANKILMSDGNGNASWVAQNAVTPNIITGSIGSRLVTCSFAQITGSTISLPVGIWNIYVGGILYSGSANFISGSVVGGQSVSGGLPYFDVVLSPDSSNTGTFQFISSNSSKVPLVNITQNEYNVNYKVNVTSGVVKLTVFGSSCLPGISSYSSNFVVNKFNAIDN